MVHAIGALAFIAMVVAPCVIAGRIDLEAEELNGGTPIDPILGYPVSSSRESRYVDRG